MSEEKIEPMGNVEMPIYVPSEMEFITYVTHPDGDNRYRIDFNKEKDGAIVTLEDVGGHGFGTHGMPYEEIDEVQISESDVKGLMGKIVDSDFFTFNENYKPEDFTTYPGGLLEFISLSCFLGNQRYSKSPNFYDGEYPNDEIVEVMSDMREIVGLKRKTDGQQVRETMKKVNRKAQDKIDDLMDREPGEGQ